MRAAATALVTSGLVRGRERGGAAKAKDIATVMSCLEVVGGGDAVSQPAMHETLMLEEIEKKKDSHTAVL